MHKVGRPVTGTETKSIHRAFRFKPSVFNMLKEMGEAESGMNSVIETLIKDSYEKFKSKGG